MAFALLHFPDAKMAIRFFIAAKLRFVFLSHQAILFEIGINPHLVYNFIVVYLHRISKQQACYSSPQRVNLRFYEEWLGELPRHFY